MSAGLSSNLATDLVPAPIVARIFASLLDALILVVLLTASVSLAYVITLYMSFPRSSLSGVGVALMFGLPAIALIAVVAWPLYFALFEASRWAATPGKRLLGLTVKNVSGLRLGFWPGLLAHLIYWMPFLLFPLGSFFQPIYLLAQMALAGLLAGLFCNEQKRTAVDSLCHRFVVKATKLNSAAPAQQWKGLEIGMERLPMPFLLTGVFAAYILLAPIMTFSFGQLGNYFYRAKISAWRQKGLHNKGKIVFVERRMIGPAVLTESDLAEFVVLPQSLPPDAIVSLSAVIGKKVSGMLNEGSVLTLENFEKNEAPAIEIAEQKAPELLHAGELMGAPKNRVLVYRWRDRVKTGQVIQEQDIMPVWIEEAQFTDSMCFAPWQIIGRTVSDRCQAFTRDIVHSQYIDVPYFTLKATHSLQRGDVLEARDFQPCTLTAKQHYYTAISAPHLVLGARLQHNIAAGQILRYCDFDSLLCR